MKLYGFCSLLLCQIGSIFGASEKDVLGLFRNYNDYVEFQSTISAERKDSVVLDMSFDPNEYILDWADLVDGADETVRAIALVCMRSDIEYEKKETEEQLKPFFKDVATTALRQLKQLLKERSQFRQLSFDDIPAKNQLDSLACVKSLALRLECAGLEGSAHIVYESDGKILKGDCASQDWYSSLHLVNSKSYLIGTFDVGLAQGVNAISQKFLPDLHMLIFHRNPALVHQGE